MAVKLVDGTQLDSDLTSVANAIRTKAGIDYDILFPDEFIEEIAAIPTGGSVTAATGEIVVASDVSSPSSSQSFTFPGLALSFQPDFLWISLDHDSWDDLSAPSNALYCVVAIKKTACPPFRVTASMSTDDYTGQGDYLFIPWRAVAQAGATSSDVGVNVGAVTIDDTRYQYWDITSDGKFKYGRYSSSGTTPLYAGTYRYFAMKI